MVWWRWLAGCGALLSALVSAPTWSADCTPRVLGQYAARVDGAATPRADLAWEAVRLPDEWGQRWPRHDGSVWYRIDWERACTDGAAPLALGISGISMAGEVYLNDELLWRDASLVEPLSRSWNVPRWWVLPQSALHDGVNAVWVRAVGWAALSPGLHRVVLGELPAVAAGHEASVWRQQKLYSINATLAAVAAGLFLLVWGARRKEQAYGWFGLMALCWLLYLTTFIADTPWPWPDSLTKARSSMAALIGYVLCACMFTLRFGGQQLRWAERVLWLLATLGIALAWGVPAAALREWLRVLWLGALLVFTANALQFQWRAWVPRRGQRQLRHRLLALCWLVFIVVAAYELIHGGGLWAVARSWSALSGPLIIALMMLLLGWQLVQQLYGIERFNQALEERVTRARTALEQVLQRERAHAIDHAKLQERVQIAHDLHDGLGGSLVRSMALVEQAPGPLPNERVLSLLKLLRDDLRQVIDHGSSAGASVPDTPLQWLAPVRHRYTRILEELGVQSEWHIAPAWDEQHRPDALQCLALTRLIEEALSNVIKHSQAGTLRVDCTLPTPQALHLRIADDGVGFDVAAVQRAGLSVGMRSMAARIRRIGGEFQVDSGPSGTVVDVRLSLKPSTA
ncbi:MAG: histidine kinase [Burkholderiales bacterium]|nr:histidine kinase [Burkholderiales bacterium]